MTVSNDSPDRTNTGLEVVNRPTGVLTITEVAGELRCSKAHVLNLINGKVRGAHPLPALWLGRRRLIRRCSLDAWIKANEHEGML
jgi:excisionase family DNA binding protein